jgi:glycosyltransferase involved in cell wall biosynthesis
LGKDWYGKGGDIALEVAALLREEGIDVVLHLVGVDFKTPHSYVHVHGLINKNDPLELEKFDRLFQKCDLLVFPSRSEGSAIAPREAAAYGLPTLAYRIDGVLSSITDGESGILLEPGADPRCFVEVILNWFEHPELYNALSRSARNFYENNARWSTSVSQLLASLEQINEI